MRLDETRQQMSELLYHERHLEDEPPPSYDWAMADPTPLMSTPIDRLENAMVPALPDQIHPMANAIPLQAMFAPSHTLFHPSMESCYIDTSQVQRPQIYEPTSHDHFGIIYQPNHYPLDSCDTIYRGISVL